MITARWIWKVGVVVLALFGAVGSAAAAAPIEQSLNDDYTLQASAKTHFKARRASSFRLKIICGGRKGWRHISIAPAPRRNAGRRQPPWPRCGWLTTGWPNTASIHRPILEASRNFGCPFAAASAT